MVAVVVPVRGGRWCWPVEWCWSDEQWLPDDSFLLTGADVR
jgi:hypothetical protein